MSSLSKQKLSDLILSQQQITRPKTVALFVSDLHLQSGMPNTCAAFLHFLSHVAPAAKQLYLLGDIFEYWAGDDDLSDPFNQRICAALHELNQKGTALFWIAGNRDFLVGMAFAQAAGMTLLNDPHILSYQHQNYLITHGDMLCTDDIAYQQFKKQVRQTDWQQAFLARPLVERKAIINEMRHQSQQHQKTQLQTAPMIMDVNASAVENLFIDNAVQIVIHGHTHRPALHHYHFVVNQKNLACKRYVLSDWDCEKSDDKTKIRGDWLALLEDGDIKRCQIN